MAMSRGLVKKFLFCGAKSFPKYDIQKGHIWVYVGLDGQEQMKFELDAKLLNHPLFEDLLRLSKEEIGYSYDGALRIVCEINLFLHLLHLLESSNPSVHYMQLQHVMDNFYATKSRKYFHSNHQLISVN